MYIYNCRIPPDCSEDERQSRNYTFALNEKIRNKVDTAYGRVEIIRPVFEKVAEIPATQSKKKGKPMAALDYFQEYDVKDIPPRLVEIMNVIYK